MESYTTRAGLSVDTSLAALIENEVLCGVDADVFWRGFADLLADLTPINSALLATREALQNQIDAWHLTNKDAPLDGDAYRAFLTSIGYLRDAPKPFSIDTQNVDSELGTIAGPQLVVPVMNARFALNAANARWGSLYDALYGTDAISDEAPAKGYDPKRGAKVIAWARKHLDAVVPLAGAAWADVTALKVEAGELAISSDAGKFSLADAAQFAGYTEAGHVFLRANGLLIEIVIDTNSIIGRDDPAGISDVRLESALTAIQDCEDSVAAVDAQDKCVVYRNWLGLMRGDLEESFVKAGKAQTRRLNPDVQYLDPKGQPVTHPGRALLLARNVGHLMPTNAILHNGEEIFEGMLDAVVTVAAAMHDLVRTEGNNSRTGSIYIVKPKMHGPEEVAFANTLYGRVEALLGLPEYTVKLGVMDEERRTSANLAACIEAVKHRCVFINTGFLDRTGDEIHTSMQAGPVVPVSEMANSSWLPAYEDGNVDAGLAAGMQGRGQIGKGMWARPDDMADMLEIKIGHPKAGANTAWVPSPTAATLHATHYHHVDVWTVQDGLKAREKASQSNLLTPPLLGETSLTKADIAHQVDNACQSILGYVVRWVNQGIGCSKVPNISDVALMEDRATLRIASQYLANWILHGITSREAVDASFKKMAPKVDEQNAGDADYKPMAPALDGIAFNAARDLVFEGIEQPSGYTEPLLHDARKRAKAAHR